MVMFDIAYHSERSFMVPPLYAVMIMVKKVAHFQPVGSPSVPVNCSSSLKDPVQRLWPVGGALKYIWLYITSVCIFDIANAFYMIAPMCNVECIKAAFHNGNGCVVPCIMEPEIISYRPLLVCYLVSLLV